MQRRLSESLDHALGARDEWDLERHLAGCPACQRARVELQRTVSAVAAAPRVSAPDGFALRLERRLRELEPIPARRAWSVAWRPWPLARTLSLGGAAAAAGVLCLLLLNRHQPAPAPAAPGAEVQAAAFQYVAATALDPLQDVAAANLASTAPMEPDTAEGSE